MWLLAKHPFHLTKIIQLILARVKHIHYNLSKCTVLHSVHALISS